VRKKKMKINHVPAGIINEGDQLSDLLAAGCALTVADHRADDS